MRATDNAAWRAVYDAVSLWLWNVLIGIDQLANAILGGYPDETISSRAAKAKHKGKHWGCVLCKLLDLVDKGHCEENLEADEGEKL